jgi:hypothetical protein
VPQAAPEELERRSGGDLGLGVEKARARLAGRLAYEVDAAGQSLTPTA